jgi:hypothetical protein
MLYCIEVDRSGIGEENYVFHHNFEKEPTKEEMIQIIKDEDIGFDNSYCKFEFYRVD